MSEVLEDLKDDRHDKGFLPQFAAKAVIDLEKIGNNSNIKNTMKIYAGACVHVATLLRHAVHVVLPLNGEIYRDTLPFGGAIPTQEECDSFGGLPAPITSFEYYWSHDLAAGEVGARAPKRISLVIDNKQFHDGPTPNGFVICAQLFSIYYDEHQRMWALHQCTPAIATPLVCSMGPKKRGIWDWGWLGAGWKDLLNDGRLSMEQDSAHAGELRADVTVVVQACHALRAGASLQSASEKIASRRKKFSAKGVGGFTYHILNVPSHSPTSANSGGETHASPRQHIRRAHIRKLPSGTLTFVRQCFVGSNENGVVHKNYRLKDVRSSLE